MFESSITAKQFLKALNQLADATRSTKPATLHNGVKRILDRANGYDGTKLNELIEHVANPPKKAPRKRARTTTEAHSPEQINEAIKELEQSTRDEAKFVAAANSFNRQFSAPAMKDLAAKFAAAAKPKSKKAALDLILSERINRVRAAGKAEESRKATPW